MLYSSIHRWTDDLLGVATASRLLNREKSGCRVVLSRAPGRRFPVLDDD
jgi:hypothetical protein